MTLLDDHASIPKPFSIRILAEAVASLVYFSHRRVVP